MCICNLSSETHVNRRKGEPAGFQLTWESMGSRFRERPCLKRRNSPSLDFSTNVQVHLPTHTTHACIQKIPLAQSPAVWHTLVYQFAWFYNQPFTGKYLTTDWKFRRQNVDCLWCERYDTMLMCPLMISKTNLAWLSVGSSLCHWFHQACLLLSLKLVRSSDYPNAMKLFSCQLLNLTGRRLDTVKRSKYM